MFLFSWSPAFFATGFRSIKDIYLGGGLRRRSPCLVFIFVGCRKNLIFSFLSLCREEKKKSREREFFQQKKERGKKMAGRRVYGGSEMTVLLRNEGISAGCYEEFLSSSSSSGGFAGSRSMLNFEEVCGSAINHQFYRTGETEESIDDDFDESLHQREKKRRLSANQVQFLEKSFEVENKLEPERKLQLAKDLGLQPRQVAIWFQNRRARWKTKQLEKDYETLKSSYDVLKADYENMLKEKEKLKAEVLHLSDRLLLKEKHKGFTEALELNRPEHNSPIDIKRTETQVVEVKQEDQSSTNSAVSDSESPHCMDGARTDSANAFEPDHSDTSYVEEEDEVKVYHEFLKLDDHSGSFDFPVEEHPFWLWP